MTNKLGIDVETRHKANLIRRLATLKTTVSVADGGKYHEDLSFSQVHLETSWSEGDLDLWLYETKGIDYVGTFEMKAALA